MLGFDDFRSPRTRRLALTSRLAQPGNRAAAGRLPEPIRRRGARHRAKRGHRDDRDKASAAREGEEFERHVVRAAERRGCCRSWPCGPEARQATQARQLAATAGVSRWLPFYVGRRGCLEAASYQVDPIMNNRQPLENADTVSLVCALLVRFPELASIRSMPAEGSVRLTFALRARLNKREQAALAETIDDHVNGFLASRQG